MMKILNSKLFMVLGIIIISFGSIVYTTQKNSYYLLIIFLGIIIFLSSLLYYIGKRYSYKNEVKFVLMGTIWVFIYFNCIAAASVQMSKSTNISKEAWLNLIGTFTTSIFAAAIAGSVSYFLVLKQIKYNNEALTKQIDENKILTNYTLNESKNEIQKQNDNAASNYIILIFAEMEKHKSEFVNNIYYIRKQSNIIYTFNLCFDVNVWNSVKSECAKYFPYNIMQELTGYYYGIELAKTILLDEKHVMEFCIGQLDDFYKCISSAKHYYAVKIRTQEEYYFGGTKVTIDGSSGNVIIN